MNSKKCIVYGCVNHNNEGQFIGELCAPCYAMITSGIITPSKNFLWKNQEEKLKLQDLCRKLIEVYFDIARDKDGIQLYNIVNKIKKEIEPKP